MKPTEEEALDIIDPETEEPQAHLIFTRSAEPHRHGGSREGGFRQSSFGLGGFGGRHQSQHQGQYRGKRSAGTATYVF